VYTVEISTFSSIHNNISESLNSAIGPVIPT
jgi:hypothetical protein